MSAPKRVLIAADLEASGIWWISSRSDRPGGTWSDLLGTKLVAELKAWNDSSDQLFGGRVGPGIRDADAQAAFYGTAHRLAVRVQEELGGDWEVLWNSAQPDWCWNWVNPQWRGEAPERPR